MFSKLWEPSYSQTGSFGSKYLRHMESLPSAVNSVTALGFDNKTLGQDGLWFRSSSSISVNE